MNREQAEKLLAALIFDDLDATSKAELTAYLQTDDELRYRLADLRMAAKLTDDAVNEGPDPVLGEQRLKQLKRLAKTNKAKAWAFPMGPLAVAAVLMFALVLIGMFVPSLSRTRRFAPTTASKSVFHADSVLSDEDSVSANQDELLARAREAVASRPTSRGTPPMTAAPATRNSSADRRPREYAMAGIAPDRPGGRAGGTGGMGMGGMAANSKDNSATVGMMGGMEGYDSGGSKVANAPFAEAAGRSSGVRAGKESLRQQNAASQEHLLAETIARLARGAPADAVGRNLPAGPVLREQEREVAKESAGKPITTTPESQMSLGRESRGKEPEVGAGIYQGPRREVAAEASARDNGVVSNAGATDGDGVVNYAWSGTVTPRKPGVPGVVPAPTAPVAIDVKKSDQLAETLATIAPPAQSEQRTPLLGDVPLVGGLFRGSPAGKEAISGKIEELGEKELAEQKRVTAAKVQSDLRAQAETDRQGRINELTERSKAYWKQQQYEAALGQLDALLAIDPLNDKALTEKQMVQDMINLRKQLEIDQLSARQRTEMLMGADEASVPYANEITYPKDWREILKGSADERSGGAVKMKVEQNAPSAGAVMLRTALADQDGDGVPPSSHFKVVPVNPWVLTEQDALSTFGLDVDTASYALCQRYIRGGYLPPIGAVRMEEFINAFDYAYPQRDDRPFTVYAEGTPSPFAPTGQDLTLLKVAVKARNVGRDQRRAAHLVFVVDASASMGQADRLPLVQSVANQLVDKLSDADRVSLITCANDARLHLDTVSARQKDTIRETINAIQPAGPTNLLTGLKLGYEMARKNFVAGQTNQVVLCSDGVANVGQTEAEAMLQEVAEDRKQAITLTCVGVGYGAYNDAYLEALANQGDGHYVFLDSSAQSQEALVGQLAASLQNVAQDARIQVQFNPNRVRRYRLIGYENRDIEDKRFRDDTVDAGAVGSGQCSTALYELELTTPSSGEGQADLGTVFVRYRNVENGQMEEMSRPLAESIVRRRSVEEAPRFFLAAGAARFAEWLRQSDHAQNTALPEVQRLLDQVSAALPLDQDVQDLTALAHRAEGLPRAPEAAPAPEARP